MEFADKWSAIVWMINKQLGQRNCNDMQKAKLTQEMYDAQKNTITNPDGINQYTEVEESKAPHPETKSHGVRTIIANKIGVGERYVQNAVNFGRGLDAAEEVAPGFKTAVLTGAVKAPKAKKTPKVICVSTNADSEMSHRPRTITCSVRNTKRRSKRTVVIENQKTLKNQNPKIRA